MFGAIVSSDPRRHPMQKIRWFFLIVGIVLVLALVVQNIGSATVHLLWLKPQLPLSVLMLSTTAIGFLFGALMTASMLRSRKKTKDGMITEPAHADSEASTVDKPQQVEASDV